MELDAFNELQSLIWCICVQFYNATMQLDMMFCHSRDFFSNSSTLLILLVVVEECFKPERKLPLFTVTCNLYISKIMHAKLVVSLYFISELHFFVINTHTKHFVKKS